MDVNKGVIKHLLNYRTQIYIIGFVLLVIFILITLRKCDLNLQEVSILF